MGFHRRHTRSLTSTCKRTILRGAISKQPITRHRDRKALLLEHGIDKMKTLTLLLLLSFLACGDLGENGVPTVHLIRDYNGDLQIIYGISDWAVWQTFGFHVQSDIPMPTDTYILVGRSLVHMPLGAVQSELMDYTIEVYPEREQLPKTGTITIQPPEKRADVLPKNAAEKLLLVGYSFNPYKVGNPASLTFEIDESLDELRRRANR